MNNPSTPLPEQGGFNERIDELAGDLWAKYGKPRTMEEFISEFKQSIRTLVLEEIIGENEPEYGLDNPDWGSNRMRNRLRAEQRKKLGDTHGTK